MEEEKKIFDATEYILLALNKISNFDEFIEYKKEIEKAINDIRNTILNLKNHNKYNKSTKNKSNKSSIIGLKYNYDSYFTNGNNNRSNLKEDNILNYSNIEEKKENNIIINKSIRNNFKSNNYMNKSKSKSKKNHNPTKKDKFSKVADIIMKLNSEDYFYVILTQLFGKDLKAQLMSNEVSDELLTAVTNSIQEIESLKKKDDLKNLEEMEEEPRQFPTNEILGRNNKYINYNKIKKEDRGKNEYTEFNFEKNLRKNNNTSALKEKPFISTTSIYGNYFDPPLQKGGISKLDDYKKEK